MPKTTLPAFCVSVAAATSTPLRAVRASLNSASAAGGPAADALFNDSRTARKGVEVAAATDTQNAGSVVFGTPVGDVVAYQPDPQQATWNVFRVTDRRTDARAPGAPATLSLQQLYLIGQRTLQPLADDLAVRVNPRYGVWDQVSLRVVPADQTAGLVLVSGR